MFFRWTHGGIQPNSALAGDSPGAGDAGQAPVSSRGKGKWQILVDHGGVHSASGLIWNGDIFIIDSENCGPSRSLGAGRGQTKYAKRNEMWLFASTADTLV